VALDGSDSLGRNPAQVQDYLAGAAMNAWWWVPIGVVAWCGVSLAVGLLLGPVLRRCSQAKQALAAHPGGGAGRGLPGAGVRLYWDKVSRG